MENMEKTENIQKRRSKVVSLTEVDRIHGKDEH